MVSLIYRALLPQLLTWDDPFGFKAGSQVLHTVLSHQTDDMAAVSARSLTSWNIYWKERKYNYKTPY